MNARIALALLAASGSAAVIACVLADPPPINNPPPVQAPFIYTDSVTPPQNQILQSNPPCAAGSDCFVVPVQADPDQALQWRVFLDLDPKGSPTQDFIQHGGDDGGVLGVTGEAGSGVRTFSFSLSESDGIDMTQCHWFTFVVAYQFDPNNFSRPLPPGGTSVSWRYEPVSDCNFFDAGGLLEGGTD